MTQMSVAAALKELKLLDARIQRVTTESRFVATRVGNDNRVAGVPIDDFIRNAQAAYQSFLDLSARRMLIKQKIVESNAITAVTVGGVVMSVAAAIETRKHSIGYHRAMLKSMETQWTTTVAAMEKANAKLLTDLQNKFATNSENPAITQVIQGEFAATSHNLVNPIELEKQIAKFKSQIEAFDGEFDLAIGASNYATMITV